MFHETRCELNPHMFTLKIKVEKLSPLALVVINLPISRIYTSVGNCFHDKSTLKKMPEP